VLSRADKLEVIARLRLAQPFDMLASDAAARYDKVMVKLSADIVRELEQAGGQPLPVENPQTKRVYMLVDIEQYDVIRRSSPAAELWTENKNERRCALIRKKFSVGITADESQELAELQDEVSAYRKRMVPLPYDVAEDLKAAIDS
jgi:hypothetical protein